MREESKLVMGHSLQKLFNRQNVAHHSSVMEINEKHDKCRAKAEERCRLFDKNSEISTIAVSCRSNSCCLWASQTTHKSEKHFKDISRRRLQNFRVSLRYLSDISIKLGSLIMSRTCLSCPNLVHRKQRTMRFLLNISPGYI